MNNTRRQQVSASRLPSLIAINYQPDTFYNTTDIGTLSVVFTLWGIEISWGD